MHAGVQDIQKETGDLVEQCTQQAPVSQYNKQKKKQLLTNIPLTNLQLNFLMQQ